MKELNTYIIWINTEFEYDDESLEDAKMNFLRDNQDIEENDINIRKKSF